MSWDTTRGHFSVRANKNSASFGDTCHMRQSYVTLLELRSTKNLLASICAPQVGQHGRDDPTISCCISVARGTPLYFLNATGTLRAIAAAACLGNVAAKMILPEDLVILTEPYVLERVGLGHLGTCLLYTS